MHRDSNPPPPAAFSSRTPAHKRSDGAEFVHWSRTRFVKECGGHKEERRANLMYEALHKTIKAAHVAKLPVASAFVPNGGRRSVQSTLPAIDPPIVD